MTERCWKISGRVQGVGFRYRVLRQAAQVGITTGYALNCDDGDVVVRAEGSEENLEKLYVALHKGPLFSRVDSVTEVSGISYPQVKKGLFERL